MLFVRFLGKQSDRARDKFLDQVILPGAIRILTSLIDGLQTFAK